MNAAEYYLRRGTEISQTREKVLQCINGSTVFPDTFKVLSVYARHLRRRAIGWTNLSTRESDQSVDSQGRHKVIYQYGD